MKKKIIIYGASDYALHCAHLFEKDDKFNVVAFTADRAHMFSDTLGNKPVVAFENICQTYPTSDYNMFVAIGYKHMRTREKMFHKATHRGYSLITYISPNAIIDESVSIGTNNIFMDGVIIEKGTKIGHNNIFWSGVTVCHDSSVENHSFFAARTILGGYSIIKDSCFIGFNSVILQNVTLNRETLVGACSLVIKNSLEYTKLVGQPAVSISSHNENGIEFK